MIGMLITPTIHRIAEAFSAVFLSENADFARAGAKLWASFGYTTAQEGRATPQVAQIAQAVAAEGGLAINLPVVLPNC